MTRSRQRKLKQLQALTGSRAVRTGLPVASALLALAPGAYAQQAETGGTASLEEIVVTATKRTENLQDVPISIQALGTEKLDA